MTSFAAHPRTNPPILNNISLDFDVIVIGGGPAGLGAASAIARQDHTTVLFDSGDYRNAKGTNMHTVPTWDHRHPSEFRSAARADFQRYDSLVTVENTKVSRIRQREDDIFEAVAGANVYTGKKVILATGVEDVFPDIPGYSDCWGSGIFHCRFCDGWEEKGASSSGVLAVADATDIVVGLHVARQALRMTKQVTLYTHGNPRVAGELTEALRTAPAPMSIDARKIVKMVKAPERAQVDLHFEDGTTKTEAFIAHKSHVKLRGPLAEQLGVEVLSTDGTMKVSSPFNQTSVKGVFAAGDCISVIHNVTTAIQSGVAAGGGAALQIQAEALNQPGFV